MRVTRSHRNNRRSHHALKEPRLSKCSNCEAAHLRHRMCGECGNYRGRMVIDVVAKTEKRLKKFEARNGIEHDHEDHKEEVKKEKKEVKKAAPKKTEKKETKTPAKKPTKKSTAKKETKTEK